MNDNIEKYDSGKENDHKQFIANIIKLNQSANNFTLLTKWLKLFLILTTIAFFISTFSGIFEISLLKEIQNDKYLKLSVLGDTHSITNNTEFVSRVENNDIRQGIISSLAFIILALTGIIFLKWIYMANLNVRYLGASDMNFSPGWAIGWYFIPFAALYKPYHAMIEIWKASKDPLNWKFQTTSPLLGWWWAIWILSCFLSNAVYKAVTIPPEPTIASFYVASIITLVSDIVEIHLAIVAYSVVVNICNMQMFNYGKQNVI